MRFLKGVLLALCFILPAVSQAALTWSGCQTITAVSDYLAYSNSVYITLSPGISGCAGNAAASAVGFAIGYENIATTNIDSILATGLTAYTSGRQVMVYYDSSTAPQCYSQIIAIGGYQGQCP